MINKKQALECLKSGIMSITQNINGITTIVIKGWTKDLLPFQKWFENYSKAKTKKDKKELDKEIKSYGKN